ncbi:hypothetical protein ACT47O_004112 [Cronobacter sakazakii]|nr:hypothetical protein [Cronobacter sakazakii]
MQTVTTVRRQRVHCPAVAQLHLQQMTGAVAQRGELPAIRVKRAAEIAECVILKLKLSAIPFRAVR